MDWFLSLG
ncbi:hypothetical protein CFP56_005503 [Quercus suber]|uniref:Uncharacterized protein n=1 Tax=Quercus suber TaxID=58331 RepID=A0AAW0LB75_QUESU